MVKPKQKGQLKVLTENNFNDNLYEDEDDWIIVKKQKINILVSPLPPAARKSTMPDPEPNQLQAIPRENNDNQPKNPNGAQPEKPLVDEQEKSTPLGPKRDIDAKEKASHPQLRPPLLDSGIELNKPDHIHVSNSENVFRLSQSLKIIKPSRFSHGFAGSLDRSILLNQRLRALILKRKLAKAGGLSRWLASLGLEQFVRLFKRRSVSKFQLVNLTMKKLKDMGATAVGPRRKLMHAIECVCQPNCFAAI